MRCKTTLPLLVILLLCCGALLGTGCQASPKILEIQINRQGTHAAILREDGLLGITALDQADRLHVCSHAAQRGISWSPEGTRLAWAEQPERAPMELRIVNAAQPEQPRVLLRDTDYKTNPVWLSEQTLAFLSDREADHLNVWTLGVVRGQLIKLIERAGDVRRLWAPPQGGALVYAAMQGNALELFYWDSRADHTRQVTYTATEGATPADWRVTFRADGATAAFANGALAIPTVTQTTAELAPTTSLTLPRAVDALALLGDGRVAIGLGNRLMLWNSDARWWQRRHQVASFDGVPLGPLAAWGEQGLAVGVSGSLLLLAEDARELKRGELNAARGDDWLQLALATQQAGNQRTAQRLLEDCWNSSGTAKQHYMAAAGRARLERAAGHPRRAHNWLRQACQVADIEVDWRKAAEAEAVALKFFEQGDAAGALAMVQTNLPGGDAPGGLTAWLGQICAPPATAEQQAWQRGGKALRAGDYAAAALKLAPLFMTDTITTNSLHGLDLLLDGSFEPLGQLDGADQRYQAGLLEIAAYQRILWRASLWQGDHPGTTAAHQSAEMLVLLLQQWTTQGDLQSARELVRSDLERAAGPLLPYADMLQQTLLNEETDRWMRRLAAEVLFSPEIEALLETRLTDPAAALTLKLARIKAALLEGKPRDPQPLLLEARNMLVEQEAAQAETTHTTTTSLAATQPVQAQNAFLLDLFAAKMAEGERRFTQARAAYLACLERMRLTPANWDAYAHEVVKQLALLEAGAADEDALASYLRVMRGMGDPLLSPARDAMTLQVASSNLRMLLRYNAPAWLRPSLLASIGTCAAIGGDSATAAEYLRRAREMPCSDGILQHILLEEAAARDGLGQHALAARLYARIVAMVRLPDPVRANALLAQAQAEAAGGQTPDFAQRLDELAKATVLDDNWSHWLHLQAGE